MIVKVLLICVLTLVLIAFIAVVLDKTLFPLVSVVGNSMYPTYKDGEIIFSTRLFNRHHLKRGDVVTFNSYNVSGERRIVIKRVSEVDEKKGVYCLGDNPSVSYDSRFYGYVPFENIVTKIIRPRDNKGV